MNHDDSEVAQVTHFMKGVARVMESQSVPDAQAMWSRIQLAERQRLAERAQLPARVAWMFAKYWFAIGAALIFFRAAPMIGDFLLAIPTYAYAAVGAVVAIVLRGRRLLED